MRRTILTVALLAWAASAAAQPPIYEGVTEPEGIDETLDTDLPKVGSWFTLQRRHFPACVDFKNALVAADLDRRAPWRNFERA